MKKIIKLGSAILLGAFMVMSGIFHFAKPDFYLKIMPDYLPYHLELVYLSGAIEALLGIALFIPGTRHLAGLGVIALLVAVFPANINMYLHPEAFPEMPAFMLLVRLPLQGLMIWWAWTVARNARLLRLISKAQTIALLIIGIHLGVGLAPDASAQGPAVIGGANSKYRGSAKTTSIVIQSNVKGAAVTNQGLAAGRAGDPIEAENGINEMVVVAPGYGARTARFVVADGTKQVITVNLEKERQGNRLYPEPSDTDKAIPPEKLSSALSICSGVTLAPGTESLCSRKTWLDDVFYSGINWNFEEDLKKFKKPSQEFLIRLWYARQHPIEPRYLWILERMYSEHPGSQLLYQTLAWHSLLRGDCPRVFAVASDADSIGILSPEMLVISSLCREISGDTKQASDELALAAKSSRKLPEVTWHQARRQFGSARQQAALGLLDCTKKFPKFVPCYETLAITSEKAIAADALQGREEAWRKLNGAALTDWTKQFTEKTRTGKWQEATLTLVSGMNDSRSGYEIEWAEFIASVAQRFHQTGDIKPDPPSTSILLGSPYGAEALSLQVQALKNIEWTAKSMEPLLRMAPTNKKLWYRLIDLYVAAGSWNEGLETIARAESTLKESSNYLLSQKARGLIETGKYPEALAIYRKFATAEPNSWKSNYNLASALERSGDLAEALTTFRTVLGLNPPSNIQVAIESKINTYEARRRKQEARGKAAAGPEATESTEAQGSTGGMPLPPPVTKTAP